MGLGLLIGDKISREGREGAGWALLEVGAIRTIPLVATVLNNSSERASA